MMRRSKSSRFLFPSFIFFAPCFAMAALLEVLLPFGLCWELGILVFFYGILMFLLGKKPSPSAMPRELFSSWTHYWAGPGRFLFFPPGFLWV